MSLLYSEEKRQVLFFPPITLCLSSKTQPWDRFLAKDHLKRSRVAKVNPGWAFREPSLFKGLHLGVTHSTEPYPFMWVYDEQCLNVLWHMSLR